MNRFRLRQRSAGLLSWEDAFLSCSFEPVSMHTISFKMMLEKYWEYKRVKCRFGYPFATGSMRLCNPCKRRTKRKCTRECWSRGCVSAECKIFPKMKLNTVWASILAWYRVLGSFGTEYEETLRIHPTESSRQRLKFAFRRRGRDKNNV